MAILVTGGAGYIGSVTVDQLRAAGEDVVVLDDLYRGHRSVVPAGVAFYEGKIGDRVLLKKILSEQKIESCVHFAALAFVGESMAEPAKYFENNVEQGVALLTTLLEGAVRRIVFSSTCATYGKPKKIPISETDPQWPANPYGWTKLALEQMLAAFDGAHGMKSVSLRYFNAAGATERIGEHHEPETHLVPNVLKVAAGENPMLSVFGNNYPTPDGTAIRDYVHVSDLADAHVLALDHLRKGGASDFINLGTGDGYSVMQVIECGRKVTGHPIPLQVEARRPGDPPELVADPAKAKAVLGWKPVKSGLETILRSQWEWGQKHPQGYSK